MTITATLKTTTQKRRSRREAIAFFFSADIADIHWYQPGRTKVHVLASADCYYCATRHGENPPDGWTWEQIGTSYNYRIHQSRPVS
jgi:hypothetical protein